MSGGGHPSSDAWSAFLDGDASEREMARLRAHVHACADCAGVVADLRALTRVAGALDHPEPPVNLWPAIVGKLAREERGVGRWRPYFLGGLAGAALALALLVGWRRASAVASGPGTARPPAATIEVAAGGGDPLLAEAEREFASAAETYERSIAKLRGLLEHQAGGWDPELRARYSERMARLDEAIAESRRAAAAAPADSAGHEILFAAYQRKIDFLADTVHRGAPAETAFGGSR